MESSPLTVVAIQAALKAGEILRRGFSTEYRVESKPGIHNLVTEYDNAAEQSIISTILTHFPHHSILAEESGEQHHKKDAETLWIIDPLDGTVNFAHRIPLFSISIGVLVKGVIQVGVVYNPLMHELFIATKGKGAYLNGTKLRVSCIENIIKAFLVTGFPYNVNTNPLDCIDRFAQMQVKGVPIRRLGSAALDLAYVAAGRFDAYWELNLNPWDIAAGILLVEEAGGKITQYNGSHLSILSDKTLIASNGLLHTSIVEHLNQKELWRSG